MSSETPATAALNQILNSKNEPSSPATKNSSTQRKAARYSLSLFNSSAAAASATALPLPPPPQPQPQPKPIGGYASLTRPDWNHSTSSNSTTTTTSSFITRNHHHHHQSQLSRSYSMATPPPLTTPQPQASASNSTPQSDPLLSRYTRASSSQPQPQPRNNNYLHPLSHLNQSSSSSSASSSSPSPATAATTTTTSTGNASSSSNITNNKERTKNPNQNGKNTSQLEAKVVILGMQGVGKTSIVHRYTTGSFSYSLTSTIGASFCTKKLSVDGCKVRLQIWDTAGQERFRSMAPMYYRGANAAILVYDITNKESFLDIQNWLNGEHFHLPFLPLAHNTNRPNVTKELRENMSTDLIIQVVGSKSDLGADKRTVNKEEAQAKLGQWTMGNVRTDMNGQMVLSLLHRRPILVVVFPTLLRQRRRLRVDGRTLAYRKSAPKTTSVSKICSWSCPDVSSSVNLKSIVSGTRDLETRFWSILIRFITTIIWTSIAISRSESPVITRRVLVRLGSVVDSLLFTLSNSFFSYFI
ncbi:hypothetical protein PSTT_07825, partial [Puccinia striiformis]